MIRRPKRLASTTLGRFEVFDVSRHELELGPGRSRSVFTLELPDWVSIVAVAEDDRFVLVRQHRHGVDAEMLETAGGILDPGEEPAAAALRELAEETGFVAAVAEPLGWVHPNPALQGNRCHLFLARGARDTGALALDEHEETEPVLLARAEVRAAMADGRISHALPLVALHRAFERL